MGIVMGVGINDGKYPTSSNGLRVKQYSIWKKMIHRCYSKKTMERQPTYIECIVSKNFKDYSYFYEWCQKQIGFNNNGWQLDKDLIRKGNKVYGESSCLFLPTEINQSLVKGESRRGEYPIGVQYRKSDNTFVARLNRGDGGSTIGYFSDPISAFNNYKIEKEKYLKELAEKYKGIIDNRAYNALMEYTVSIDD